MVKIHQPWLLFFLLLTGALSALEVQVIPKISESDGAVYIDVIHPKAAKLSDASFSMEGLPLPVRFIARKELNTKDEISTYLYTLPPQQGGLHLLPAIQVMVDGQAHHSYPVTYTIRSPKREEEKLAGNSALKLEAEVQGQQPLFPGQRASFIYRILYRGEVNLTKEFLPLTEAKGFTKIGGLDVQDHEENGFAFQEIVQVVQAKEPGRYRFPASQIEGVTYQGFSPSSVTAEFPPITVEVLPFPELGKPASFSGALGIYTFFVKMLTPPEMKLGDFIKLEAVISGDGDLENIQLPNLQCQPGFSGRFLLSDLPPIEKNEGKSKTFLIEMRALSSYVTSIPPIEFSYFNPVLRKYGKTASQEIPIKVKQEERDLAAEIAVREPIALMKQFLVKPESLALFSIPQSRLDGLRWPKTAIEQLAMADKTYGKALEVIDALEQKNLLNQALQQYLDLEEKLDYEQVPPQLFANIGNLFTQLQNYPFAILYYKRAIHAGMGSSQLLQNIAAAEEKLFIPKETPDLLAKISLYLPVFSIGQWWLIIIGLAICWGALAVYYHLIIQSRVPILLTWLFAIPLLLGTCHLFYLRYLTPVEGVVVQSSFLYRGPGTNYAFVDEQPLPSGFTARVVEITPEGEWIKIWQKDGTTGYLPAKTIRLI